MHVMHSESDPSKTLGRQAAFLVITLHAKGQPYFTLADVAAITGLSAPSARSFVRSLVTRGLVTRLQAGLFTLVPFELGMEREYLGNPYLVARELSAGSPAYISHASAMDLHGLVTQPQLVVYITSSRARRPRVILGTEFRFIRGRKEHMFGTTELWVGPHDKVTVSDAERTIVDGLRQPQYCGGITEVAKGLWMARSGLAPARLVEYALRLGTGAVLGRLGFLLETYDMGTGPVLEPLQAALSSTYALLDPLLPREGKYLARWRLRLNVTREELLAVVGT